jgi:tripartite-type tricarboxylate transporter receptor subunit TctC
MLRFLAAALALAAVTLPLAANAQPYPSKPVRLIVPFAPGGGSDFIARLVAQKLGERLGQPVVIENKPGAGGNVGAELAVKSPPDGYTLLLCPASYTVNANLYKLTFDPINDITPIVQLSRGPYLIAVHPSVPANNLRELAAIAKADPNKLSYASSGNGSHVHVATEYLLTTMGIKAAHIPYKGTGPALNDAIAGNVHFLLGSVGPTLQHVKTGRLRGLAVTTPKRISALADLPTVMESGYPAWEVTNWHGILGPKGLPRDVVERLNREVNEVLKTDELKNLLATDGLEPAGGSPADFTATLKSEVARWKTVSEQARVKLD